MKKELCAVCGNDRDYLERLADSLSRRESFPFSICSYYDNEVFLADLKKKHFSLVLAEEDFYKRIPGDSGVSRILLKEKGSVLDAPEHIWKYQSAESIRRQLMSYAEAGAEIPSGSGAGSRKTQLIGVFSPVCRSVQTSFSLLMGQTLAKKGPVLYLNLEPFSGLSKLLPGPADRDLTDLVYYLQGGKDRLVYKLESMVGNVGGLDYVSPAFSFMDLAEVSEESWLLLIKTLREMASYSYVILDLSEMVRGLLNVLRECDLIYTISDREGMTLARMEQYEDLLKALDYSDICQRAINCPLPRFRKLPSGIDELPYSELAGYVKRLQL